MRARISVKTSDAVVWNAGRSMRARSLSRLGVHLCVFACTALNLSCSEGPPYFVQGSARLSDCSESPGFDYNASTWFDMGTVEILSEGCDDEPIGERIDACSLTWTMTQSGNEVSILVDEEYRINGRLCGNTLSLEGGFWLPVVDEGSGCTYEDDSAAEVGIEAEGNRLEASENELRGDLIVRERCRARYSIVLSRRMP